MISLNKLNMCGAWLTFFITSENLGPHSVGIDTAFATMAYLLAQFSVVLVQPTVHKPHVQNQLNPDITNSSYPLTSSKQYIKTK